jgi:hypothetical protein
MNAKETWRDPIVAELHRVRGEIAERYHHDLDAIAMAAEEKSRALGFTIAAPKPRPADISISKAG